MLNKFNFLLLLLLKQKKQHISIFVISILIVATMASLLFISSSLQKDIDTTLNAQADITVQKYRAGKLEETPKIWVDEFLNIEGISRVQGRVYGQHYYEPKDKYFIIVGIDFYDEQIITTLKSLIDDIDIEKFLARKNMIIGSGVKDFLYEFEYFDYYVFRPPDRSIEKIYIYDSFPVESTIVSNDMIIMSIDNARKILGLQEEYVTDIIVSINNPDEYPTIYTKLIMAHFDTRIITKDDIKIHFETLFNYKGGIFLTLYIIVLLTFLLILYQRYSMVQNRDVKEVAILRSLGWRIDEIIFFKLLQNAIIAIFAYIIGIILAFVYVYYLGAPLFRNIFLLDENLTNAATFSPNVDFTTLLLLFFLFVVPFLMAIIIPLWKISIQEISESIK